MSSRETKQTRRRSTGGQSGIRGYLVQTLIALLDLLLDEEPVRSVTLEPNHVSEQFDILWEVSSGVHAIQVKSTGGQFTLADVTKWAIALEAAGRAVDLRLCLVGLHAPAVAKQQQVGRVRLELRNHDIDAFREQTAHRLDRFLRANGLPPGSAERREMLADALSARLAAYSTIGATFSREELVKLLTSWIRASPSHPPSAAVARWKEVTRLRVEQQLSSPYIALKYNCEAYVPRVIESDIAEWLEEPPSPQRPTCFLVLAAAGCGKTNLLCQVASMSACMRPTILATGAQLQIQEELGLWALLFDLIDDESVPRRRSAVLAYVAEVAAASPKGIVLVLDAINEFYDPAMLRRELSVFLDEAQRSGVSVLLSCRDYYWGMFDASWWDGFVRVEQKGGDQKNTKRLLGNFNSTEGASAFALYCQRYEISAQPEGNAQEQLRHPLLLRFFCETNRGKRIKALRDVRLKELFDHYWNAKLRSIAERMLEQGEVGVVTELMAGVGQSILNVAGSMLQSNKRTIPTSLALSLTMSSGRSSQLFTPYGRILDEHIILEELSSLKADTETVVAFVFEEFMEYAMARSLMDSWRALAPPEIGKHVATLTTKYDSFGQVFGVVLYVALMLKEERGIALWPVLIALGKKWEQAVLEAFRKLPPDQIDDGVFHALIELLEVPHQEIQIEALELLKFGRLRRIPTPELVNAVGRVVTHDSLKIRRRAILALAACPAEFAIPLIERSITTRMHRVTDQYVVVAHALKALAQFQSPDAVLIMAKVFWGYWHAGHRAKTAVRLLDNAVLQLAALIDHPELLVRLGAISLLGMSDDRTAIHFLEAVSTTSARRTNQLEPSDRPKWVDNSSWRFVEMRMSWAAEKGLGLEQYAARDALTEVKKAVSRQDRSQKWRQTIDKALGEATPGVMHPAFEAMIQQSYSEPQLVARILKVGLEQRSGATWTVRGKWDGITIKAARSRLVNKRMTAHDVRELQRLLGVERVSEDGVTIGTASRHNGYWKEFIYRAWGVPPKVMGYTD